MLKIALVAIASIAVLAGLALGSFFAYAAIDKEDSFYVVDAQLSNPDYLSLGGNTESSSRGERFGFAAHHVQPGKGVIFGYRFFSNGNVIAADDEQYRKVTVWLPAGTPRSSAQFDLMDRANVVVIFSRGASAWPRNDCSGYLSAGTLRVEKRGARYGVSLSGQLEPHAYRGMLKDCEPQPIALEFAADELSLSQLTPWLGSVGAHPYNETYR